MKIMYSRNSVLIGMNPQVVNDYLVGKKIVIQKNSTNLKMIFGLIR